MNHTKTYTLHKFILHFRVRYTFLNGLSAHTHELTFNRKAVMNIAVFTVVGLLSLVVVRGGKILLLPYEHGSHVNFFAVLGSALKDAGHDVTVMVPLKFEKLVTKQGTKTVVPKGEPAVDIDEITELAIANKIPNPFTIFNMVSGKVVERIRNIFSQKEIFQKLRNTNYDLIIIDGIDFWRASYLIPYALNVPFVTLNARHDPWSSGLPVLPSVEGCQLYPLYGDTNVIQRITSIMASLAMFLLSPPSPISEITDDLFLELVPEKPGIGFAELYKRSEMFLINMDIICLDFHRISAPHYQYIGGLGAQPAKPLPADIESFANASQDGLIILTFGSSFQNIDAAILNKMLTVFTELKQQVLIRHTGDVSQNIPKNVRLLSWLPQNDLLGHPKTRLFITHNGNNGQLEAVHHGVPMLMMPFFGDQFYNARRAEMHQFGLTLKPQDFTKEDLRSAIKELLENPKYRESIRKCSAITRALPKPQDIAVFWIGHILKFGGSHLKPSYMNTPLYKVFMLDVFAIVCLISVAIYFMMRSCCRLCCKRSKTKAEKSKSD